MELQSINVSLPKEIEFNNEKIQTGIFKKPVTGSVDITQFNVTGDQQVDLKIMAENIKPFMVFRPITMSIGKAP